MIKVKVAFFGSSTENYDEDIECIFECLFDIFDKVVIINGGYQGTMKSVAEIGQRIAKVLKKFIFIQGILFDGYYDAPGDSKVDKQPNALSNSQLSFKSIGDRVQSMIELADLVIALPGRTGTLHEIFQTIETVRYGMDHSKVEENFKRLMIHNSWRKSIDALNGNKNISDPVHKNLINNLFDFDGEKEEKRKQFKSKIRSIYDSLSSEINVGIVRSG